MSKVSRVASLDIPSETQFEAKEWRMERLGWIGMALIIILGGLGLLGGEGPFNTLQLGSLGDKIRVESRRVIRNQAPFELKIYATTEQSFVGTTTLHINKSYAENFVIESFSPTLIQEQVTPSVKSDDVPTILLQNGMLNQHAMKKLRIDEADIMKAARHDHGLERLEQIRYAIVEEARARTPMRSESRALHPRSLTDGRRR